MKSAVRIGLVMVFTVALSAAFVPTAFASHVACGQVITQDTVLDSDIGPCPNNGIVIGADNIMLNLNGHRVFGTPEPGDGAGILLHERTGVRVRNGTVTNFDGGVVIEGGSANKVFLMTVQDNIGSSGSSTVDDTLYGDGIAITGSRDNEIRHNRAIHNGPFDGIGLFLPDSDHPNPVTGRTRGNIIVGNTVLDNNICRQSTVRLICDNDGIRLEPGVHRNVVEDNVVKGSALDGIAMFFQSSRNVVRNNVVEANGFHAATHRKGDGIRVFAQADFTRIRQNRVVGNAANGIIVGSKSNEIIANVALRNSVLPSTAPTFDLRDTNPNCDANVWSANQFGTADPPCTTAP